MRGTAIRKALLSVAARFDEGDASVRLGHVAQAFGYVGEIDAGIAERLERIGGVLYRLTHR